MAYGIYVISNSELFQAGLNAVAAFCHSEGFKQTLHIGTAISIIMTLMAYIKQHDLLIFTKFVAMFLMVSTVLLGVGVTVAIYNTADQTIPPKVVDNVPLGIALPAHLITAIGYGFTSDLEMAFAMPEETQYHKTGMLFASNLFRLSLASRLDSPAIMNQMNDYVRSCVLGDVLINHKYSFDDLLHSSDAWGLMTSKPSQIRGMYVAGIFKTCLEASKMLTVEMDGYSKNTAPNILAKLLGSKHQYAKNAINTMLVSSYQYFLGVSKTATDILKQNIAINAFRAGINNYAAETGSIAAMENIANTTAMMNTRMAWATSRHIGIQTLPLMQVVLLLLLVCIFPLMAVLIQIPGIGINVFKSYIYSLMWLETWPIMFATLNMAMNFYASHGAQNTVTLSNINLLTQEHSDIAGIAGYLVLAIPFLSMGIVKGMAFTFNNAAQYLGGMIHSIAQSSAAPVTSGNFSFGNISTENATANTLSANKHDTNFTNHHGLSSEQLANGAIVTTTPSGDKVYSNVAGMSQLATTANAAHGISTVLSNQIDKSLTSAYTHNTQYMESHGHNEALGTSMTDGMSSQVDSAMTTINSLTHSLAKREDISNREAFQKMLQTSNSAEAHGSVETSGGFSLFGNGVKVNAGASIRTEASERQTGTNETTHANTTDSSISKNDAHDFREALSVVKNYSKTHSLSEHNTDAQNFAIQMGTDLNQAERLSSSAQYVQSHSASINTNFNQAFASFVQQKYPQEADAILSATGNSPLLAKQEALAEQFIQVRANQLVKQYASSGSQIQSMGLDPQKYATQNYQKHSWDLLTHGKNLGIDQSSAKTLSTNVNSNIDHNQEKIIKHH